MQPSMIVIALSIGLQPTPASDTKPAKPDRENEVVCESIRLTGSRLGSKRFCATRAEWKEKRRQDRETIDRAQILHCVPGANC